MYKHLFFLPFLCFTIGFNFKGATQVSFRYFRSISGEMNMPYMLNPQNEIFGKDTLYTDGLVRIGYQASGKITEVYCSPFSFENDIDKAVKTVFTFDNNGYYRGALFFNRYNNRVPYEGIDQYQFICDEKGRIVKRINQNRGGQPTNGLVEFQYQYEWDDANHLIQIVPLDEHGATQTRSATHVFEYNTTNQLVKKSRYLLTSDGTLGDLFDAYTYEHDDLGRISKEKYFWNEISQLDKFITYAENGLIASIAYTSKDGNPTRCSDGYHRVVFDYNANGNKTSALYLDVDGKPMKRGEAHEYRRYDPNGKLTHVNFFDIYNEPETSRSGVTRLKYTYDVKGRLIESERLQSSYYYSEPNDITDRDFLKMNYSYDQQNRVVEMRYQTKMDSGNNLIALRTIRLTYNAQNQVIDQYTENVVELVNGEVNAHATQIDISAYTYDANGNITEHSFLDRNRQLLFNETSGYARISRKFNAKNQLIEESRFNENNEPFENYEFPARRTFSYDDNGYCTEECIYRLAYDEFRDTLICTQKTYTDNGLLTKITYLDGYGNLFPSIGTIAMITYQYDAKNRRIEVAYFDREGKLIQPEEGTAITRYVYDSEGNKLVESYFGSSNESIEDYNGIAKYTYRYDGKGNQIEIANYNRFGELTMGNFGEFAIYQKTLNSNGELASATYFNAEKQQTYHADYHGYETYKETHFFPTTGKVWRISTFNKGNQTRFAVYDGGGRLKKSTIKVYDEAGHLESERWVDENNRLKNNESGYAFHNVIDNTFYSEKNKRIPPKKVLQMSTSHYELVSFDEQGNKLETSFLNHRMKPTLINGYHSINHLNNRYYDIKGQEVLEVYPSEY